MTDDIPKSNEIDGAEKEENKENKNGNFLNNEEDGNKTKYKGTYLGLRTIQLGPGRTHVKSDEEIALKEKIEIMREFMFQFMRTR